jgi:DnaJ family protein A protein 2
MPAVRRDRGHIEFRENGKGELIPIHSGVGNLYIEFDIKFPENGFTSDPAKFDALKQILPPANTVLPPNDKVIKNVDFEDVDPMQQARARDASAMDVDDDDEGQGGERVQCASQ